MRINEKNIKSSKISSQMTKSFLKVSKSESTLIKRQKKSSSVEKQKNQMSKNDQRVTIYCDKQGFIVQYSILSYGLKCDCAIIEGSPKKISRTGKNQNMQSKSNQIKKKIKLQITLNKQHLAIIKSGIQHIFPLPSDTKHDFLKIVLTDNWELQQFHITNKKTKIVDGEMLSASQNNCDEIFPLKNIVQADQLRKCKLLKTDSKVKIAWGNTQKDTESSNDHNEILSFTVTKKISEAAKPVLFESSNQIQRAFLRKSFNQCDQTRDSQQEPQMEEKIQLEEITLNLNRTKSFSINFDLWNHTPKKQPLSISEIKLKKEDSINHTYTEKKSIVSVTQRFFK